MKLKIVLNGGLKSCCSTYPPEFVHEVVKGWLDGICDVAVTDAEGGNWTPDNLASLAIKYFGEYAYPFIYVDDALIGAGYFPPREELIAILSQEQRNGITSKDIVEAAKKYGTYDTVEER